MTKPTFSYRVLNPKPLAVALAKAFRTYAPLPLVIGRSKFLDHYGVMTPRGVVWSR